MKGGILPTPSFCGETWARRGGRFLRTPRRCFLPSAGGLQPIFFGRPSIPPSFAEIHPVLSGEFFPAGIPHPSLSPPGNPGEGKLGAGKNGDTGIRGYGSTAARQHGIPASPQHVEKHLTFREKVIIDFKNRGKESKTGYESGGQTLCEFSRIPSSGK
jgi:hypothetical protein